MQLSLPFAVFAAGLSLSAVLASDDAVEPHGDPVAPKFTCILKEPNDVCAFSTGRNGLVLRITSESGIGYARLTLIEGDVPSRLTIEFPKMGNLESFALDNGKVTLGGSLGCDALFDKQGTTTADAKNAVYSLRIRKNPKDDRCIQVDVSLPHGEAGAREWRMNWIDAFRR